tara:strand:- start:8522 stop:10498 length:1977 start_codon:yes stop_codon:yes gene_type:complete
MANWKKVIVSGSNAELSHVTASEGMRIPTASLSIGSQDNFILTISSSGDFERRDPKTIGAAFQSMSVAGPEDDSSYGTNTFIAKSGLNELVFVSGSNVQIQTSQSLNDPQSETVGYVKITAATSSVTNVSNQTTISGPVDSVYTVGTVQDIATTSDVQFANINVTGDITASRIKLATEIVHDGDPDTKIVFGNDEIKLNTNNGTDLIVKAGKVGIGNTAPTEELTVTGDISASGNIFLDGDISASNAAFSGDIGVGGSIFGLTGFGVTIDDVAITSGSVNFGSGSNPATTTHKFTGSISVTGSGITLVDGVFTGNGSGLTNLDADNLDNVHNLTWGNTLTQSIGQGSVYNPTSSVQLNVNLSGSEIATGDGGLFIPSNTLRIDQLTTSSRSTGDIISFASGTKAPYAIPIGSAGQVLTVTGGDSDNHTASFQDLPTTNALGVETGSFTFLPHIDNDGPSKVGIALTGSGHQQLSNVTLSGSTNQITVSGSHVNQNIHLRLADNIIISQSISTNELTASALRVNGNITASGDLFIGGNFQVAGNTTLIHTSNVLVEDAFLTLASGSTATDGGIIIQDSEQAGRGFGWDNTIGRWGLQDNLHSTSSVIVPSEWMVSARISSGSPETNENALSYGQGGTKASSGQVWIDTGSKDIWIYIDA